MESKRDVKISINGHFQRETDVYLVTVSSAIQNDQRLQVLGLNDGWKYLCTVLNSVIIRIECWICQFIKV